MRTHSSKVLHIQKKQKNKKKLIRVHVQEPQKYFTYKKKQQQNNRTTKSAYVFLNSTSHTKKQNSKTTKSDTRTHTHSSKVLHIQKTKKQKNLIRIRVHIPQEYFTNKQK